VKSNNLAQLITGGRDEGGGEKSEWQTFLICHAFQTSTVI
jgi:hypothetical protein